MSKREKNTSQWPRKSCAERGFSVRWLFLPCSIRKWKSAPGEQKPNRCEVEIIGILSFLNLCVLFLFSRQHFFSLFAFHLRSVVSTACECVSACLRHYRKFGHQSSLFYVSLLIESTLIRIHEKQQTEAFLNFPRRFFLAFRSTYFGKWQTSKAECDSKLLVIFFGECEILCLTQRKRLFPELSKTISNFFFFIFDSKKKIKKK